MPLLLLELEELDGGLPLSQLVVCAVTKLVTPSVRAMYRLFVVRPRPVTTPTMWFFSSRTAPPVSSASPAARFVTYAFGKVPTRESDAGSVVPLLMRENLPSPFVAAPRCGYAPSVTGLSR